MKQFTDIEYKSSMEELANKNIITISLPTNIREMIDELCLDETLIFKAQMYFLVWLINRGDKIIGGKGYTNKTYQLHLNAHREVISTKNRLESIISKLIDGGVIVCLSKQSTTFKKAKVYKVVEGWNYMESKKELLHFNTEEFAFAKKFKDKNFLILPKSFSSKSSFNVSLIPSSNVKSENKLEYEELERIIAELKNEISTLKERVENNDNIYPMVDSSISKFNDSISCIVSDEDSNRGLGSESNGSNDIYYNLACKYIQLGYMDFAIVKKIFYEDLFINKYLLEDQSRILIDLEREVSRALKIHLNIDIVDYDYSVFESRLPQLVALGLDYNSIVDELVKLMDSSMITNDFKEMDALIYKFLDKIDDMISASLNDYNMSISSCK